MDYFGMLNFSCVILGGGMLIGVALYIARGWWLRREERRSLATTEPLKEDEYDGMHQALPQHVDEYDGLKESLLLHIEELLRKVDRQ